MVAKLSASDSAFLVEQLICWFRDTKRDLPWRQTYDPYHVWISEIMLQQTQMERGVAYFLRWIKRFPTVREVASASENDILVCWEGLGYYARARNLHKAAKEVVATYSGIVPSDYKTLLMLPGIGPYTAAAVASIAGEQDVVVVDANVNRIFARLFDIQDPIKSSVAQKKIRQLANRLLPLGKARIFNQALMDFGGLVCTPKGPQCKGCTIQRLCKSYQLGIVSLRPVVRPPQQTVLMTRVAGVIVSGGRIFMQKRASTALWGGLWEFPGGESLDINLGGKKLDVVREISQATGLEVIDQIFLVQVQYQYTHHKVKLCVFLCSLINDTKKEPTLGSTTKYSWVTPLEMDNLPCPSGVRKVIEYLKLERPEMFTENYAQ